MWNELKYLQREEHFMPRVVWATKVRQSNVFVLFGFHIFRWNIKDVISHECAQKNDLNEFFVYNWGNCWRERKEVKNCNAILDLRILYVLCPFLISFLLLNVEVGTKLKLRMRKSKISMSWHWRIESQELRWTFALNQVSKKISLNSDKPSSNLLLAFFSFYRLLLLNLY